MTLVKHSCFNSCNKGCSRQVLKEILNKVEVIDKATHFRIEWLLRPGCLGWFNTIRSNREQVEELASFRHVFYIFPHYKRVRGDLYFTKGTRLTRNHWDTQVLGLLSICGVLGHQNGFWDFRGRLSTDWRPCHLKMTIVPFGGVSDT